MSGVDVKASVESGELSTGQDAGTGRTARKKGPTVEINRGWFM